MTMIDPPSTRRGRPAALLVALVVLAAAPGCSGRDRPRRGWLGGASPAAEGTTIGRDLRVAPRGTVAPAASLGVDLVRESRGRRSDAPPRRDELAPVGYSRGRSD